MTLGLDELRGLTGGQVDMVDVACPLCGPGRRSGANRIRKVLRIWDDGEFITYKCARCEASGWAKNKIVGGRLPVVRSTALTPSSDKSSLAAELWRRSRAATGTLAETYLRSRQCWMEWPSIRFLPAHGRHPPCMIARFGSGEVTGVHLTRLREDGSKQDKIMLGPSAGQPIILHDNHDRGELLITEGIEDAASLALVTGWSAWAAGAAGRVAVVVSAAQHYEKVFIAVDHDSAGLAALRRARVARRDIIPIDCAKMLGLRECMDPNKVLLRFGQEALLGVVEWSEVQADFAQGRIGFHLMQRQLAGITALSGRG